MPITKFKKHVRELVEQPGFDFQRPNLFEVEIDINMENVLFKENEDSPYVIAHHLIKDINVPSSSLGTTEIKRMGRRIVLPTEVNFSDDIQIVLLCDIGGKSRVFFQDWQQLYYQHINSPNTSNQGEYITGGGVKIYSLDGLHERTSYTQLYNAFPRLIGEMPFSHDTENTLQIFSVSISFSYAEFVSSEGKR